MGPRGYGLSPLVLHSTLAGGVGRAHLGRLVEVDRDALPLVEVHRLGLVRERDAAHRALHVDARQDGHDGGGGDRSGGVDRPLPGVELIPGERLVDQGRVLVALRVEPLERRARGGEAQRRGRERRPDDVHAVLARGLPELLVDVVPAEHDVAAEAGPARLRDGQRAPGRDLGDDHERLRLVGEQALERRAHVVRVARERLGRHVDAGERRARADRLAEALAVGRVLGDQRDPLVAALDHERHEGARRACRGSARCARPRGGRPS